MSFIKIGEAITFNQADIQPVDSILIDAQILENFAKFASNLKRIAPKAEDFLYFSAVMMHAAEASTINDDGTPKLTAKGDIVKASWDTSNGSYRWVCNDSYIKPVKNSNGDIFPEHELIKAYKKWVGKPLCIDHKSSSVDHVRGIIVDTYYDRALKRVIALCALDKQNYPDLAKKITTGVSNSVSMGTAVGRAVCTDCGTVAKVEADFCKCMRNRTCYGEINLDLNPIELSIVVNGADPKAKIKHIIAAANSLSRYLDQKQEQLSKIASKQYKLTLSMYNSEAEGEGSNHEVTLDGTDLEAFKRDVEKAMKDLEDLNSEQLEKNDSDNTNDLVFNQSGSTYAMEEPELESTDFNIGAPPALRFAASEEDLTTLAELKNSIEVKLTHMKQDLDKLVNSFNKQEEIMSGSKDLNKKAYFQGAGDVNEPTPGSPKYSKDPLNEKLREKGDKQMETQDTGGSDGLFPGDLEAKKLLARATSEQRALRRQGLASAAKEALLNKKEAYFQGTEEPVASGKRQYPVDPLNEKLREDGDKQMEGQKPFPGVGKVDGLHPSPDSVDQKDELKRKEMLARASLRARFIKASKADGSHDLGKSAWEVFLGDKLILTASVNEISGGRADALYSAVATETFGKDLISKVKTAGVNSVKAMYKSAQDAAPVAPPAEAGPGAPPAPMAAPVAEEPAGTNADGDPKEVAVELSTKVKDLASDLNEVVHALVGEQAEMGDMDALPASAEDGKVLTASLFRMRKELNGALKLAVADAVSSLNDVDGELGQITSLYDNNLVNDDNREFIEGVSGETFKQAKEAIADAFQLLGSYVKYARGTESLVKRAASEAAKKFTKKARHGDEMSMESDEEKSLMDMLNETNQEVDSLDEALEDEFLDEEFLDGDDEYDADDAEATEESDELFSMLADDLLADENHVVMVPDAATAAEVVKTTPSAEVEVKKASFDMTTKAGRTAARAKLAADMKFAPWLAESHGVGLDVNPGGIDNKSEGDLGTFETVEQVHSKMLDLANAPPSVRKEASMIAQLVKEGKINPDQDFPALIANGLDSAAVAYWKKYFASTEGGSEFASEMIKEHAKAQAEEEMATYKVKIARAYEIANEMVSRELLPNNREAISAQVDEVMKWNDDSIESFKRIIAKHSPSTTVKTASGRMPQVFGNNPPEADSGSLYDQLASAFSGSSKRSF